MSANYWFAILLVSVLSSATPARADLPPPPSKRSTQSKLKKPKIIKTAGDPVSLRRLRRMGLGAGAAGPLGLGGILLEMNFMPDSSVLLGLGGGPGYQTFVLQSKQLLSNSTIAPYFMFGYARWTKIGNQGSIEKSTPGYLSERLLTEDQKTRGTFSKNLVYPAFGFQYMELSGDYAGSSVFAEIMALVDAEEFLIVPTGGLGVIYYF